MTNHELIGLVGATYLRERMSKDDEGGTARYLLDCLTPEQTGAIAEAIYFDAQLTDSTEIKLPKHFVGDLGLLDEFLTTERTTYFRNAACSKPILLVANTGDDEEQSLKELEPIGRPQLLENTEAWVQAVSPGLQLTDVNKKWWIQALNGLLDNRHFPLERFASYVLATKEAIENGHPILAALGVALPALQIPRDTAYFNGLSERTAGHRSKWKNLYRNALNRRACYLRKQTPTQGLLTEETLRKSFDNVSDMIPSELYGTINDFIASPSGWNKTSKALAVCEWESVKPIFDGLRREKFNLGKATLDFYDEREEGLLSDDEHDYLNRLTKRNTRESQEEDDDFYRNHKSELKENTSLKAKWDRFIYGKPIETNDFLSGIVLSLEALFDQDMQNCKQELNIWCDKRAKVELKKVNNEAGKYFAFRYRGLKTLFGKKVSWDVGHLFEFDSLCEEWQSARNRYVNRSVAKAALRLKFFLELEVEFSTGQTEKYTKQLIWTFNPMSIPAELSGDWRRLSKHPLVRCVANLEPVSGKGHYQSIDLHNARTLMPTYDRNRGSFVAVYKTELDIACLWPNYLSMSKEKGLIDKETSDKLVTLFNKFKASYSSAIKDFVIDGIASITLLEQAKDYHNLLNAICRHAKGDRNRELLLKPLMEIGAVRIEGGKLTTIVAPWHPLRIAAMATKAMQVSSLIRYLLDADEILFGDTKLFFKELKNEIAHPYYPEIVLSWTNTKPELLSLTDAHLDYSLHEPPIASYDGFDDTNENPSESAELILNTVKRFLALYPHEKTNLSLVLYNSDSARLPQSIVDKISKLRDDEEDMRCQIILRHRDSKKLNDLYIKIVETVDTDPDSSVASETAKDFMARLRIGIMVDQAPIPDPKDGPPADLVFLQDVITRHAKLEWYRVDATPIESSKHYPPRWSRRRPSATDDMKSIVFLCSPVQTEECWSYITALTSFLKGKWDGDRSRRLLPARQLDFNDPDTASIFKEIHNLGNWVVNYDELLDRRQLLNQNVRIIQYKQLATQGRNVLVSSTAPLGLLQSMVHSRIRDLNIDLTNEECKKLTDRFLSDATEISGDIVLRAAKRGRNASELMGIVLSHFLIQQELGASSYIGWYFLDDYAEWLGQKEEQIADILALVLHSSDDGKMRLSVIVCESKYIHADSLSNKRRESQKQLRDTVRRISDAIFGDPRRLDRDLWLSRFSDLVLNGIQFPASANVDLNAWRRAIREGACEIYLRGYSHIFVCGPTDAPECSDFVKVAELSNSYQEVYSRSALRELIKHYWKNTDPMDLRRKNAEIDIWANQEYKPPTEIHDISSKTSGSITEEDVERQDKQIDNAKKVEAREESEYKNDIREIDVKQKHKTAMSASSEWAYPGIGKIIAQYQDGALDTAEEMKWLKKTENVCKGALQQFQLRAKLLSSTLTPNAALLKFLGSADMTVEKVSKRTSEFLTTHGLPIISVRAEPGTVVISIARPNRRILHLLDVWKEWRPDCTRGNHKLLVGLKEEDSSRLFISPKENSPHTLIAGSTGSGKSVLMQNIILAIACTNTVEWSRITLIDPKCGVDYFPFEGLPHLQGGVIDNQDEAISSLTRLVDEMNRRYEVLRSNRVSSIYDLNKKKDASVHLPFLWVIHDEFAEWMMTDDYRSNVANIVARLGVKARAAGIFLVFAAQRPDNNVMPMQLRSNLGNRLILRVDGEGTSEIALGEKGAEKLLGKGHVAVKLEGHDDILTAQVPFIEPSEIETIVSKLGS